MTLKLLGFDLDIYQVLNWKTTRSMDVSAVCYHQKIFEQKYLAFFPPSSKTLMDFKILVKCYCFKKENPI